MPEDNTILNPEADADQTGVGNEPQITGGGEPQAQQPASGEYDYTKMVGEGGALADNWREALPENIRSEKCLDQIKNVRTLAQSYVHAQHAIGANRVAIPGENATAEEWSAFYKACGRPDKADDYKQDAVELPEGVTLDDAEMQEFRKFAFEHGISQKTFEAAVKFDVERARRQAARAEAAQEAEFADTMAKLSTEYGEKRDAVIAQCNKTLQTFGLGQVLAEHGLLNNFAVIKALAQIGGSLSESRLKGAEGVPAASGPQARLDEIRNNPDDPFHKKDHPAHKARVEEVARLLAALQTKG